MTRNQLIRLLCIALVTATLALALILAVAVIGGTTAEGLAAESDMPHFQPFFPDGSFDIGDLTFDPEDFTRDPDATRDPDDTLPPEPEMTLPDWESGWEWPTLPPSLSTEPDIELPTLPEGWDTLPDDWDTLPPEWSDLPIDPDELADLLAGMNGGLGMPPGAIAAGVASQLTVMEIFAERSDRLYLKMQSFGDYTGRGWDEAQAYGKAINGQGYSALYLSHYLMDEITSFEGYPLTFTPKMDVRVIPYYIVADGDLSQLQPDDVSARGATDQPYTLYYRPYGIHKYASFAEASLAAYEAAYAEYVGQCYLEVDETTLAYMRLIIKQQGFDKDDPEIFQKVASYIQNAATYNLAYNQNLDQEPNVALAFLGAYKEGVCRHYATAATLLFRALGIPARYTVGFMTDVKAGEITPVKGMDAHAWVEVYEEGFGWRCVEVTGAPSGEVPGYPGQDTETGTGTGTETETETEAPPAFIPVTLKPVDMEAIYTGAPVVHTGEILGFEEFEARGFRCEAVVQGEQTECGRALATIQSYAFYSPDGQDVTAAFDVTLKAGVITVYQAELTFTSVSLSKVYDGATPLRTGEALLTGGTLPEGYTAEIISTGKQTMVGTGYAAFDVKIWYHPNYGDPRDDTDSFLIRKEYGTLTVTPAALTVKAGDAEKVYDGEALTSDVYELLGTLAYADHIAEIRIEGSQTRVGHSENLITDIVIRNMYGEDVTLCYTIEVLPGTLRVTAP